VADVVDHMIQTWAPEELWSMAQPLIPVPPPRVQGGGKRRSDDRAVLYIVRRRTAGTFEANAASPPASQARADLAGTSNRAARRAHGCWCGGLGRPAQRVEHANPARTDSAPTRPLWMMFPQFNGVVVRGL
jgi:hypothetical protein